MVTIQDIHTRGKYLRNNLGVIRGGKVFARRGRIIGNLRTLSHNAIIEKGCSYLVYPLSVATSQRLLSLFLYVYSITLLHYSKVIFDGHVYSCSEVPVV